ncbi:MAG: ribulose-phosphate 3-epimerase [Verrucomicrobiia bacterium]
MKLDPILAPSLLAGDHADLGGSALAVPNHGLKWLHLDIMDGHFVPNLTFGPEVLAALRRRPELADTFFDTHLMLSEPANYIEAFAKAGSDLISIHIEPEYDHAATLADIRKLDCQNGIVLNPGTPVSAIEPFIDQVDLVLVMTVQPGFGGQSFREDMVPKLQQIDAWREERALNFRLEVDGGVDLTTGPLCRAAGADTFVAGTAFFKAEDRTAFVASVDHW